MPTPNIPPTLAELAVPIDTVKPHPDNVREGDVGAIAESLTYHGQYRPLVVSQKTGHVLAGNHTLKAAISLGWDSIAVTYIKATKAQEKRILLIDNRANDLATYDDVGLAEMLAELAVTTDQLAGTGFDVDDLDQLLQDLEVKESYGGDGVVPDPPRNPRTKPGDRWQVGKDHIVVCGDATDESAYGEPFDLMWTDPPYGVSYLKKLEVQRTQGLKATQTRAIANDHMAHEETADLWREAFIVARQHAKPDSTFYATSPAGDVFVHIQNAILAAGWQLKHSLVWNKHKMVLGHSDYHYKHEMVLFGWNEKHNWYGNRKQVSVFDVARPEKNDLHPTMKPVDLIEPMIRNSTKPGMLVLDPFSGSGSTALTALLTDRRSHSIELDPAYVDVIVDRLTGAEPKLKVKKL